MSLRSTWIPITLVAAVMAIVYLPDNSKVKHDYRADFDRNKDLITSLAKADLFVIYEGLPHQDEREAVAEEKRNKKTIMIRGYDYYESPIDVKPQDLQELRSVFANEREFGFLHPKGCPPFHPDFCFEWKEGENVYYCTMCFGCHEAKSMVRIANSIAIWAPTTASRF